MKSAILVSINTALIGWHNYKIQLLSTSLYNKSYITGEKREKGSHDFLIGWIIGAVDVTCLLSHTELNKVALHHCCHDCLHCENAI